MNGPSSPHPAISSSPYPVIPPSLQTITYSPAYTVVPTYECFNRCTYCNFRTDPGQSPWLDLAEAKVLFSAIRQQGVIEVLVLSGEVAPNSSRREDWFRHMEHICQLALEAGLLPHTNAGPLGRDEMAQLQQVNVSMGLMVEQVTPRLLETVHRHAPSKRPELRLQQLTWAGELGIPFTTGLLLGLGETQGDWVESLTAIATLHRHYGHIQEVILQPHSPGQRQSQRGMALSEADLVNAVALARSHLPADITVQIPPNLISRPGLFAGLKAGARDIGGISPVDEVNPDYDHPEAGPLGQELAIAGWRLVPRLPIYPQYDPWLPEALRAAVNLWRTRLGRR